MALISFRIIVEKYRRGAQLGNDGRPINAFRSVIATLRPVERVTAIMGPNGTPRTNPIRTAGRLKRRDRRMIKTTSRSREPIRPAAFTMVFIGP
jgi:hypothetical protein